MNEEFRDVNRQSRFSLCMNLIKRLFPEGKISFSDADDSKCVVVMVTMASPFIFPPGIERDLYAKLIDFSDGGSVRQDVEDPNNVVLCFGFLDVLD